MNVEVGRWGRQVHLVFPQGCDDRCRLWRVRAEQLQGNRVRVDCEHHTRSGFESATREPSQTGKQVTNAHGNQSRTPEDRDGPGSRTHVLTWATMHTPSHAQAAGFSGNG